MKLILFIYFYILFINLCLAVLDLPSCSGFSLVTVTGGYSLAVVHGLLIVVASLIEEHRL